MATSNGYRIVFCTCGSDEQAEAMARELVGRRLAACVNIVGQTCSIYRWRGEIVRDAEKLLVIKTDTARFGELRQAIRELHSYDVPEILAVDVTDGDPEYLHWLGESLGDPEPDSVSRESRR